MSEFLLIWPPDIPSALSSDFLVMMFCFNFSMSSSSFSVRPFAAFSFFLFEVKTLRRHRCHVVLARISAGEQVVVLAPLRLRVLGCLVARGNRLLPHKNTLRIHEVRIPH